MSETTTTSGGAYYATAVELRGQAATARRSYPEALARAGDGQRSSVAHANNLIVQAVALEVAAALYCVAQAIEDGRER